MIKRFNPDFSLSISHELAYMRETPEGGYVAHGDYATLFSELESVKAERDALAMENAVLKGVVGEINEELYGKGLEVSGWHLNGDLEPLDNWFTDNGWGIPETPATDAALADIEARGVNWIEGNAPPDFGRYWVRYETDVGPQYCSAKWLEYNFCASSDTNIHKIWLADNSRSINSLRGVTHYTKLPKSLEELREAK